MENLPIFYSNELEVSIDISQVDPNCYEDEEGYFNEVRTLNSADSDDEDSKPSTNQSDIEDVRQKLLDQEKMKRFWDKP